MKSFFSRFSIFTLLMLFVISLFSGCFLSDDDKDKDKDDDKDSAYEESDFRVSKVESSLGHSFTFTYDADGYIAGVSAADASGTVYPKVYMTFTFEKGLLTKLFCGNGTSTISGGTEVDETSTTTYVYEKGKLISETNVEIEVDDGGLVNNTEVITWDDWDDLLPVHGIFQGDLTLDVTITRDKKGRPTSFIMKNNGVEIGKDVVEYTSSSVKAYSYELDESTGALKLEEYEEMTIDPETERILAHVRADYNDAATAFEERKTYAYTYDADGNVSRIDITREEDENNDGTFDPNTTDEYRTSYLLITTEKVSSKISPNQLLQDEDLGIDEFIDE